MSAVSIKAFLSGEKSNGGIIHNHGISTTVEKCGETFCAAGVTTNLFVFSIPFTYGLKGAYVTVELSGQGISSSGGAAEVCNFNKIAVCSVNKDGSIAAITLSVVGGSGVSGALTNTFTAVATAGTSSTPPTMSITMNSNRDLWTSWCLTVLFGSEF